MSLVPALLAIALASQAPQVPGYWGSLRPGPHAVGFSQRWIIDSTRRLPNGSSGGPRHRPVLMNLWYPTPAQAALRMRYRDYFSGPLSGVAPASPLGEYASALTAFARDVAVRELTGSAPDSVSAALRRRLDALFDGPTAVYRDAPMRTGRLPVVCLESADRARFDRAPRGARSHRGWKRVFERYSLRDLAEIWQEYLTLLDPSGAVKPRP